jgi:hypothetical protein
MKKIAFILAVISLAACNPQSATNAINTAETVSVKVVDTVQAVALTSCAFVPTAATIAAIVSAGTTAPAQMATAICAAITAAPKLAAMTVTPSLVINGQTIVVEGHYIRK